MILCILYDINYIDIIDIINLILYAYIIIYIKF